jgi:hypothetical protein
MVVRCLSLNTPRRVAWYFDFSSCSTTRVFYVELSFFLDSAVASFLTSLFGNVCVMIPEVEYCVYVDAEHFV